MAELAGGLGTVAYAARATPAYVTGVRRRFDPLRSVHNWRLDNTRRLRAGIGRAGSGGEASIVAIGDSEFAGAINGQAVPGEYQRLQAIPIAMRDALACKGIPTAGTGFIRIVENTEVDSRWVAAGVWTNQKAYATGAVAATATLTPDRSGAGVAVMYYGNGGRFTIAVNGAVAGAGFVDITAPNDALWRRAVLLPGGIVAGTAAVVVTVVAGTLVTTGGEVFTPNGGLSVHNIAQGGSTIVGSDQTAWSYLNPTGSLLPAYLNVGGTSRLAFDGVFADGSNVLGSATGFNTITELGKEIILANDQHFVPANTYIIGFVDATHALMSNNATAPGGATNVVMQIDRYPDAVFIELGANDHPGRIGGGGSSIADMIAGLTVIAGQWSAHCDVVLFIGTPLNSATLVPDASWEAYAAAVYALAETLDVPLVDLRNRSGNWTTEVANTIAGDNAGHLRAGSYVEMGRALAEVLAS